MEETERGLIDPRYSGQDAPASGIRSFGSELTLSGNCTRHPTAWRTNQELPRFGDVAVAPARSPYEALHSDAEESLQLQLGVGSWQLELYGALRMLI